MKKIVGTIAAAALIASAAFADVGIGAWGRTIWAPVAGDAKDVVSVETSSWAWEKAAMRGRVGFSVHAESENVGFNVDVTGENMGTGDTQYIWVKPWDFLTLSVGKVQDNSARGDAGFGAFNWIRNSAMAGIGEDFTFMRLGNGDNGQATGAIVKVTPIEGLWIAAAIDVQDMAKAEVTYGEHSMYGAGYTIEGIGNIKAQFIGRPTTANKKGDTTTGSKINVAFDLTAVENLYVGVGAFIPVGSELTTGPQINAYGKFSLEACTIHALFGITLFDSDSKVAPAMVIGAGLDVNLGNGIGLNADFRFRPQTTIDGKAIEKTDAMSFMAGITKGFSNGVIGVAFQGTTDQVNKGHWYNAEAKACDFAWEVPVKVEYWF